MRVRVLVEQFEGVTAEFPQLDTSGIVAVRFMHSIRAKLREVCRVHEVSRMDWDQSAFRCAHRVEKPPMYLRDGTTLRAVS